MTAPTRYTPTLGDLAYRDAVFGDADLNPFDEAVLLQGISHTYLAVMLSDNAGPTSAGTTAMLDAELSRRGGELARRANRIAVVSFAVAIGSLLVSIAVPIFS